MRCGSIARLPCLNIAVYIEIGELTQNLMKRLPTGASLLISKHFFYFGRNAIDISEIPDKHLDRPLVKRGQGYRSKFPQAFIEDFAKWLSATFSIGVHGLPCKPRDDVVRPKCLPIIKRKSVRAKEARK
jgi:hypothetical protein